MPANPAPTTITSSELAVVKWRRAKARPEAREEERARRIYTGEVEGVLEGLGEEKSLE